MKRLKILFLFYYGFILQAIAQEPQSLIKQTGFREFSVEQGLSQNTIQRFYQDKTGYIWIATDAGLNRLDGNQIQSINGLQNQLTSASINNIMQDSNGEFWITTYNTFIKLQKNLIDTTSYQLPSSAKNLNKTNYSINLFQISDNTFWLIARYGIYRLNTIGKDLQSFASMQLLVENNVDVRTALDDENFIWLGTSQGLYQFNKKNHHLTQITLPEPINNKKINHLLLIDKTTLLVASNKGLVKVDSTNPAHLNKPIVVNHNIASVTQLNDQIFYSFKDQVHRYTINNETEHLFSLSDILPKYTNYTITNLFIDKKNKLWIGTDTQGAYLWNPDSLHFKSISSITDNHSLKLSDDIVWSFLEDELNNFWISTNNGINYLDIKNASLKTHLNKQFKGQSADNARIFSMLADGETLWLASNDGLIKYTPHNQKREVYKLKQLPSNEVFSIYSIAQTPDKNIWIASENGVLKFNPETKLFSYEENLMPYSNIEVASFVRFQNDLLWFGFADKLISYNFKLKKKVRIFNLPKSIPNNDSYVNDFHIDDERLWVSFSGEGIFVVDLSSTESKTQIIKSLNRSNGFVDNVVFSLLPDKDFLWASTYSGLAKINKHDFTWRLFNHHDGLPGNEFNEGASFKSSTGKLLFGSTNGLLAFDPNNFKSQNKNIIPHFTEVQLQDRKLIVNGQSWSDRKLKLTSSENFLSVQLSTLDFLSPKKWHYQYWLSGTKNTEPMISKDSEISFSNLPAGSYQLNVRAVLANNKISQPTASLDFFVESTGWMTKKLQAIIAISFFVFAILFLYLRSRYKLILASKNKDLKKLQHYFNLALKDKRIGTWRCKFNLNQPDDSTISVALGAHNKFKLSSSQYLSHVHPKDSGRVIKAWKDFISGKNTNIDITYRIDSLDSWIWNRVRGHFSLRHKDGTPIRAEGTWQDVSKEIKLQEQLGLFDLTMQYSNNIIIIVDESLNVTFVNNAYYLETNFQADKIIGKNILQLAQNQLSNSAIDNIRSQIRKKNIWEGKIKIPHQDGNNFAVETIIYRSKNNFNNVNYIIVLSNRAEIQDKNSHLIIHEKLTGLPNKIILVDRLQHAIKRAEFNQFKLSVVTLELTNLNKLVSQIGEIKVAEIILNCSKLLDDFLNESDTLTINEQNQFIIIFENITQYSNLIYPMMEIIELINTSCLAEYESFKIEPKAGISCFPLDAKSCNELINYSNVALNNALQYKMESVVFYHNATNKQATDRIIMKNALAKAIVNDDLFLVFQPKYSLENNRFVGFEILIRWKTQQGDIIYPTQFIDVIEESNLIEPLTKWFIDESFKTLSKWRADGFDCSVALNFSSNNLYKFNAFEHLLTKLQGSNLLANNIHIEINQKYLLENYDTCLKSINLLADNGVKTSIDSFNSHTASLSRLRNLPLYGIKLDPSLTQNINHKHPNAALVKSIIELASSFNFVTSVKEIKSDEQFKFLRSIGCNYGLGYYFSDPLSEKQAFEILSNKVERV